MAELLDVDGSKVDSSTIRRRDAFKDELAHIAIYGKCTQQLYVYMVLLARVFVCQTQEIEGMNSMMKLIIGVAPHISLPLLSSRVCVRKLLNWGIERRKPVSGQGHGAHTGESRRRL